MIVTVLEASSSSSSVSSATSGAVKRVSETLPWIRTCLSGASTTLSTPVTVTSPVLSVALAAKLSVVPASSKSAATPSALTVTSSGISEGPVSVAVTVLTPPFSEMESGVSTSVTAGAVSPSVRVMVRSTPKPMPSRSAEIVTVSPPSNTSSARPVTVVVTELAPAARLSVVEPMV